MISVDYDVAIRREPADVFEYVTQVERIPEWQHVAGVRKVTKTDHGPLRVGSRFSMQRESRSGVATIDCEVTALEPGREFDFHSIDNDGFAGDFRTTVTPNADGTNLHWAVRMQPPNLLFRLLQPMIAREIRKSADSDFVNLKRILETSATS